MVKKKTRYDGGTWEPPRITGMEYLDHCTQMADRFNRMLLRVLRQMRDLRRYSVPVTINNPKQVNIAADGGQQVNVQAKRNRKTSTRALVAFARKHKEQETQVGISLWQRARAFIHFDNPILRWAPVAGLALAIVVGTLLWGEVVRLRSQLDDARTAQLQLEQEIDQKLEEMARVNEKLKQASNAEKEKLEQERDRLKQEIGQLEQQIPENTIVSAVLEVKSNGISRGGPQPKDQRTISIPASAKTVRLQLDLTNDDFTRYVTVLLNEQGKEIWRDSLTSTKTAKGRSIILRIPAKELPAGDYQLLLDGLKGQNEIKGVAEFSIRIVRK